MASPDILLVETDHDMRNPADSLILNTSQGRLRCSRHFQCVGPNSARNPDRAHFDTLSVSMQGAGQLVILPFMKERMNDMRKQADELSTTIDLMQRMYDLMQQLVNTTHHMVSETHDMAAIQKNVRDHVEDFDDFGHLNYFYWERHRFNIPICWSLKSIFETLDGVDEVSDKLQDPTKDLENWMRSCRSWYQFPAMITTMQSMRTMMLTMGSTMSGVFGQMDEMSGNAAAMGKRSTPPRMMILSTCRRRFSTTRTSNGS